MSLSVNDWFKIAEFILWIVLTVVIAVFGGDKVSSDKHDAKSNIMTKLINGYVEYYAKTELPNETKKNSVIHDVSESLKSKGFKVDEQTLQDIEALTEKAVNSMNIANGKTNTQYDEVHNVNGDSGTAQPIENLEDKKIDVPDAPVATSETSAISTSMSNNTTKDATKDAD